MDESALGWAFDKLVGPVLGALGVAALAWVRKLAQRLRKLADHAANAEAMEERFATAADEREGLRQALAVAADERGETKARVGTIEAHLQGVGAGQVAAGAQCHHE